MSETISQLPAPTARPTMRDIVPVTLGYTGPNSGVTYAVPIGRLLSAADLIHAEDPAYGVMADGVTDDTTAWQLALQAAFNLGAWVIAPVGVSLVSAMTVPDGVGILGRNAGSASPSVGFPTLGSVIKGSSASNATVSLGQFCKLWGLQIAGTNAAPCVAINSGYCDLFDCTLFGGSVGVAFSVAGGNARLLGCRIHDCLTAGVQGALATTIAACTITNCGSGVQLTAGCNGVRLTGGTRIEYSPNYGLSADGTGGTLNDLLVSACSFDASGKANILLRGVSASTVSANSMTRGGQGQGVTPASADDTEIYLRNCNGVSVIGNVTRTGLNDQGSGYNSPFWAVFDGGGNTNSLITANILTYHNNNATQGAAGPINVTTTWNLASAGNVSFWS